MAGLQQSKSGKPAHHHFHPCSISQNSELAFPNCKGTWEWWWLMVYLRTTEDIGQETCQIQGRWMKQERRTKQRPWLSKPAPLLPIYLSLNSPEMLNCSQKPQTFTTPCLCTYFSFHLEFLPALFIWSSMCQPQWIMSPSVYALMWSIPLKSELVLWPPNQSNTIEGTPGHWPPLQIPRSFCFCVLGSPESLFEKSGYRTRQTTWRSCAARERPQDYMKREKSSAESSLQLNCQLNSAIRVIDSKTSRRITQLILAQIAEIRNIYNVSINSTPTESNTHIFLTISHRLPYHSHSCSSALRVMHFLIT